MRNQIRNKASYYVFLYYYPICNTNNAVIFALLILALY